MHARTSFLRAALAGATFSLAAFAAPAGAQATAYPSFQAPRVTDREFNFGLADANPGTSLLFQWREGQGSRNQLSLDLGFTDYNGGNLTFIGGQFARQLATSNASMPFDVLLTAGANLAHASVAGNSSNGLRIPVGVSAGHVFPLEGGMTITPYIHPRLVIAHCNGCFANGDDTNLGLEFDLGGEFKFNSAFALRLSAGFGDNDTLSDDSFGVSLAWTPGRMSRSHR